MPLVDLVIVLAGSNPNYHEGILMPSALNAHAGRNLAAAACNPLGYGQQAADLPSSERYYPSADATESQP